jgi:hypothetical protein
MSSMPQLSPFDPPTSIANIKAADIFSPAMRQRIDVASLYAKALRAVPESA